MPQFAATSWERRGETVAHARVDSGARRLTRTILERVVQKALTDSPPLPKSVQPMQRGGEVESRDMILLENTG